MTRTEKRAAKLAAAAAAKLAADAAANAANDLAAAADVVAAIGAPPDAAPLPPAVPAPLRRNVGNASHVDPVNVHAFLQFNGATLNGIGTPNRRDPLTVTPITLTAADVPALYARAAMLLACASSPSINAPDRVGASPCDRRYFLTRAAERCIAAADRTVTGKTPVRSYSGGYNGDAACQMRIASVRDALLGAADTFTDALSAAVETFGNVNADVCDPLIVAHLATRKTATRPDGGYFAVNIGTIDR